MNESGEGCRVLEEEGVCSLEEFGEILRSLKALQGKFHRIGHASFAE